MTYRLWWTVGYTCTTERQFLAAKPRLVPAVYEMLDDARTYGLHSGRDALRKRLEDLGLLLNQDELNHAFAGFQSLTDFQSEVSDEDLVRIANNGRRAADGVFDAIGHVYR